MTPESPAPEQAPPDRPRSVAAAAVLLCAAWLVGAVTVLIVLSDVPERAASLRRLNAVLGRGGGSATRLWLEASVFVALLLVAGVLVGIAIPGILHGRQPARVAVWIGIPLLVIEPLRQALLAIGRGHPDITIVTLTLVGMAPALLATLVLALPSVNAYVRAQTERAGTAQPLPEHDEPEA